MSKISFPNLRPIAQPFVKTIIAHSAHRYKTFLSKSSKNLPRSKKSLSIDQKGINAYPTLLIATPSLSNIPLQHHIIKLSKKNHHIFLTLPSTPVFFQSSTPNPPFLHPKILILPIDKYIIHWITIIPCLKSNSKSLNTSSVADQ